MRAASIHKTRTTIRTERTKPLDLPKEQQEQLAQRLYTQIHQEVFEGVTYECFLEEVVTPGKADDVVLYEYFEGDKLIGYLGYWHVRCRLRGQSTVLVRSASGILKEYRHKNIIGPASATYLGSLLIRFPLSSIYVSTAPISPTFYASIDRTLTAYWPNPYKDTPTAIQQVSEDISTFFDYVRDEENPMVRDTGWKVRGIDTVSLRLDDPVVRYYCEHNPHYADGYGLITVAPINWKNALTGLRRLISKRLRRRRKSQ
ncbi:MAG: hypothetical protein CL920_24550 [Deltaproteobacteria bacterium]|nr:hypothetical protein [Deltaproteobacteria bacterium]